MQEETLRETCTRLLREDCVKDNPLWHMCGGESGRIIVLTEPYVIYDIAADRDFEETNCNWGE